MNGRPAVPTLVALALGAAALGILCSLPLLVRETHYTFAAFMFLGQPLLAAGFFFFAWKVLSDLRRRGLL